MITLDDFKKLNIVVGTIEGAEEIKGSEKLYKFTINLSTEIRQILGGLRLAYSPNKLVGRQVVVLANLEPHKLIGLESNGMILCASDSEDKPVIISPLTPVANGTTIR